MVNNQSLIYEFNNGRITEIDKSKFIDLMISLHITSMKKEDLLKLSYKDIIKLHIQNFKKLDNDIYAFTENKNKLVITCLLDKNFEDFKKYCKKQGWLLEDNNNIILYHGSKSGIEGKIRPASRATCDFGRGFYTEPNKIQAEQIASIGDNPHGYKVSFNSQGLKIYKFENDIDWALFIAKNRRIEELDDYPKVKNYLQKFNGYDLYIGTIADDIYANTIPMFFNNSITLQTLIRCLDVCEFGNQYVFATQKACNSVKILEQWKIDPVRAEKLRKDKKDKKKEADEETYRIIKSRAGLPGTSFYQILEDIENGKIK